MATIPEPPAPEPPAPEPPVHPTAVPLSVPARPELTDGLRVGVLLSHGFTGSPASMRPWGEALAERGYAVEVPRLPGHGTTWQQLNATGWHDWYAAVARALDRLVAENDRVVVGGLSMGGGLVLQLAADRAGDVAGVVLVNAAVTSTNKQLYAVPLLKHVLPAMPAIGNDIKKPGVTEHGYDRTPLKALHSMMRGWRELVPLLPRVSAPVLLFRSATDHVVDPSSARLIIRSVSTTDVTERVLEESFHVATLDNDAPRIFTESADFIGRVTGRGRADLAP